APRELIRAGPRAGSQTYLRDVRMLALVAVSAALVAPAGALAGAGAMASRPLLAIAGADLWASLVRVSPATLRPVGRRVSLDGHDLGWSFSPDGRLLAVGNRNESCRGGATELRLVDARSLARVRDVRVAAIGAVRATDWLDARNLLAVVSLGDCVVTRDTLVASVDPSSGAVRARRVVRGDLLGVAAARGALVLLLSPADRVGAARLAVVDAAGGVRRTTLAGVAAGRTAPDARADYRIRSSVPGLAVDAGGGRAFVVAGGGAVAEVDLRTLAVRYHALAERRPAAAEKGAGGPERHAAWLGGGLLAVTGSDATSSASSAADAPRARGSGRRA